MERRPTAVSKLASECLCTFFITATATTVDVLFYAGAGVDGVSRWLARGFVVAAIIYAFSETSGAHADPAVTFGFALRRVFPWGLAGAYIAAQFAGAFAAAGLTYWLFGAQIGMGASHPGPHFTPAEAAICELVLTFALMLVILMTAQEKASVGKAAALAVGFTVSACGFAAGPISGASMNPARTLAPAILAGAFGNVWIYTVGPLAGAALAVLVHVVVCGPPTRGELEAAKGK